jgi:hypothetical protein
MCSAFFFNDLGVSTMIRSNKWRRLATNTIATAIAATFVFQATAATLAPAGTTANTDIGVFGVGGLRGNAGGGSITVSGVSGTVTRAYLLWHGIATSQTGISSTVTFAGSNVPGTSRGASESNCWDGNTVGTGTGLAIASQAYSADVTSLVTGNGSYTVNGLRSTTFDPNGASLIVFFDDGNSANNKDVSLFWGNDSGVINPSDPDGWVASFTGINYSSGSAALRLIVSDGQTGGEPGLAPTLNGTPISLTPFDGSTVPASAGSNVTSGGLWDQASFDPTSFLSPGPNTLTLQTQYNPNTDDCLSLVGALLEAPSGTLVVAAPPQAVPSLSALGLSGSSLAMALWGVYGLRARRQNRYIATRDSIKKSS